MGEPQYMRFPEAEFKHRYQRVQELLAKSDLKGLFITEGGNYTYFSGGTRDFSFSRPHTLLIPRKGEPVAIIQRFPEWNRRREIWFDDVRIYDTMLGLPMDMVLEAMKEHGMASGKVGAELGYEQRLGCSPGDFAHLKERLPKVEFVDAADILWGVRMIKSEEEIARTRKACEITVRAYDALFPILSEGMSEADILERFNKIQIAIGGSSPWSFINSGPEDYFSIGGGPSNRRIEKGNQVWIDGGCQWNEYGSDFCCAGTVGKPSPKQKKMQKMVWDITRTIIDQVRPGMRACDLDTINNAEWEKRGFDYPKKINWGGGRIGHGLGWGATLTEPPHIAPYDRTMLKPGMCITIEPAISVEYGCYQCESDIVITEDGCDTMNKMDHELRVIPA